MSKISINLVSLSPPRDNNERENPRRLTYEEAQDVFNTCLLALGRLGNVASMIEVITLQNYVSGCATRQHGRDILWFRVKVVLVEPITVEENSARKFTVEAEISSSDHTPTPEKITDAVVRSVIRAIQERADILRENRSRMTRLLKSVVTSSEAA